MIFTSPAKINLYLRVVERLSDGYHRIETLFERISFFDNITVEKTAGNTTITCDNSLVPTEKNSLVGKTVELFKKETHLNENFKINIEKKIPIGAGLGGGSSNAGTILKALNSITGEPVTNNRLMEISKDLGADVPFFVSDCRFAYGENRGDIIKEVKTDLKMNHILITPPVQISTKQIYQKVSRFALTNNRGVDTIFSAFLNNNNLDGVVKNLRNDLQQIVLRDFPILEKVFTEFKKVGAKNVLLSGSGSTVFGVFEDNKVKEAQEYLKETFPSEDNWNVVFAQTF